MEGIEGAVKKGIIDGMDAGAVFFIGDGGKGVIEGERFAGNEGGGGQELEDMVRAIELEEGRGEALCGGGVMGMDIEETLEGEGGFVEATDGASDEAETVVVFGMGGVCLADTFE